MSYFKAEMRQVRFRPETPLGGGRAYSAVADYIAGFKGPTSKGKEGRGRKGGRENTEGKGERYGEEMGKGRGTEGGEGRHSLALHIAESTRRHCCSIGSSWV